MTTNNQIAELGDIERPTTSFYSKRQIKTQQERRVQQFNGSQITQVEIKPIQNLNKPIKINQSKWEPEKQGTSQKEIRFPKTFIHDQEKLYEELIQTKQALNVQNSINHKIKTKMYNLEQEIRRKDSQNGANNNSMVKQDHYKNIVDAFYKDEDNLTKSQINLQNEGRSLSTQQYVKQLRQELIQRDEQLKQFQKLPNQTRIRELEIQNQVLSGETIRLQSMLTQALQFNQSQKQQNAIDSVIDILRNDNIEMAALLKEQQTKINQLTFQLNEKSNAVIKFKQRVEGQSNIINQLQKELDEHKFRDPYAGGGKKQGLLKQEIEQLKLDLDKKFSECNQLNNTVMQRDKRISELEKSKKDIQIDYVEKIENLEWERNQLKDRLVQFREEVQNNSTVVMNASMIKKRNTQLLVDNDKRQSIQLSRIASVNEIIEDNDNSHDNGSKTRRLQKVSKIDVINLGRILRYRLIQNKINLEKLDDFIFDLNLQEQKVSIAQIRDCMMRYPFNLNHTDSLLIARYLIEDNTDDEIIFSLNHNASIPTVRSILKNLLGRYTIYDQNQTYQLILDMAKLLNKNKILLYAYIAKLRNTEKSSSKISTCNQKELIEGFQISDITFNAAQMDFIFQQMYQITKDLDFFDLDQLYTIFNIQNNNNNNYNNNNNNNNNNNDNNQESNNNRQDITNPLLDEQIFQQSPIIINKQEGSLSQSMRLLKCESEEIVDSKNEKGDSFRQTTSIQNNLQQQEQGQQELNYEQDQQEQLEQYQQKQQQNLIFLQEYQQIQQKQKYEYEQQSYELEQQEQQKNLQVIELDKQKIQTVKQQEYQNQQEQYDQEQVQDQEQDQQFEQEYNQEKEYDQGQEQEQEQEQDQEYDQEQESYEQNEQKLKGDFSNEQWIQDSQQDQYYNEDQDLNNLDGQYEEQGLG